MTVALKPYLSLCPESVEWLLTQPDAETAWNTCDRPSWMLWVAEKAGVEKPVFVRITCEIARTVLHFVPADEDRPRLAIEAAEAWLANPNEENTIASRAAARAAREVARDAAWAAVDEADAASRAAAEAASWAAYAARAASRAAAEAASCAARTAACAAYWAASWAARAADAETADAVDAVARVNFADIIRKNIPFSAVSHLVET